MMQKPISPEAAETAASHVADADSSVERPREADAAADDLPEPPLLVWPPPEEDLADWHVIPLLRPESKPVTPPVAHASAPPSAAEPPTASTTVNLIDANAAANKPKRTPPAWLVNHKRVNIDGSPMESSDAPSPQSASSHVEARDGGATGTRAPHDNTSPGAHPSIGALPHAEPRGPHQVVPPGAPPRAEPQRVFERAPGDGVPTRPTLTAVPTAIALTQPPVDAPLVPVRPAQPTQARRAGDVDPGAATSATPAAKSGTPATTATTGTNAGGHAPHHEHEHAAAAASTSLSTSPLALDRLEHARAVSTHAPAPARAVGSAVGAHAPTAARTVGGYAGSTRPAPATSGAQRVAVIVLALLAVGQAAYIGARLMLTPAQAAPASVLIVNSEPTGADVFIDGQRRGETPFRADVPPGDHVLELRKNGRSRTIPLILAAGVQSSQYVEMSGAPRDGSSGGSSSSGGSGGGAGNTGAQPGDHARGDRGVAGGTSGAAATGAAAAGVNNAAAPGATAASASDGARPDNAGNGGSAGSGADTGGITAGSSGTRTGTGSAAPGTSSGPVTPASSSTSTPPASNAGTADPAAAAPAAPTPAPPVGRTGLVVESPLNLTVLRNGEVLGNSDEGRIALGAGHHELELRNDSVGYRAVMSVEIPRGRVVTLPVELPQSTLDISAIPSARVSIDGRPLGITPITQIALPVGPHEVRFEHQDFGERTVTVLVRVGATARATVDFLKP